MHLNFTKITLTLITLIIITAIAVIFLRQTDTPPTPATKIQNDIPALSDDNASAQLYTCHEGSQIYVVAQSAEIISMTLVHADTTYSTTLLEKKTADTGMLYADKYDEHKLIIVDGEATFTINDIPVASACMPTEDNDSIAPVVLTSGAFDAITSDRMDYMFFGDPALNRVVIMKLSTFEEVQSLFVDGDNIYCVDHVTDEKSYIMARGSDFIQVIQQESPETFVLGKKIVLPFHPRTGAKNRILGLELISGKDKAMFALVDIDTDTLLATGGSREVTKVDAVYGGSNATGHAQWISFDTFIFADRASSDLTLYHVAREENDTLTVTEIDTIMTPFTVHTFFDKKRLSADHYTLYATLEGDTASPGGVVEISIQDDALRVGRTVTASGGVHHAEAHPTQDIMYIPTGNGFVDIVDQKTMTIIKSVPTGKGSGHVTWVPKHNIAIILNHEDTYITVLDMTTHEKITDIEVAQDSADYDTLLQSHSTRLSPDSTYYYGFATDSGTFFRVNLKTLSLDKELYVGGTPKQASQPDELY